MTTYQTQMIETLEQTLAVAMRHQNNLDADAGASIHKEHAQQVARIVRKLNKAKRGG